MFFFIQFPKISIANNQEKLETAADFITLGKLQKSLRILKNIKPNDTAEENEVDYLIGRIFQELNKPKKAIKYYDKVLTTNSSSSKARLGLAESYLILGELKKATFNAEIALQKNSSLIRAILILAEVDMRLGRENEANSRFEKLLGANPNSEEVAINYVTFLINQEQTDKAISYLKDFEKNNSDLADIKDLLGRILWHQGEKQEAFNYRLQAVNIYKNKNRFDIVEVILEWMQGVDPDGKLKKNAEDLFPSEPIPVLTKKIEPEVKREKIIKRYEAPSAPSNPRQPFKKVRPGEIVAENFSFIKDHKMYGSGSGFIVNNGRMVITNYHVIEKSNGKIGVRNGYGKVRMVKRIVAKSKKIDLAILELKKPYPAEFAISNKKMGDAFAGRKAIVMGYPLSYFLGPVAPALTEGVVSKGVGLFGDLTQFQITAKMNTGNSGGPVFDVGGNLIGIAVQKLDLIKLLKAKKEEGGFEGEYIPEDVNFAIKASELSPFVREKIPKEIEISERYSLEDIYQMMLPKVVFLVSEIK